MKKIWIIGASEGIGKEVAIKLAKYNKVFISGRQKDKLQNIAQDIGSNAQAIELDVSDSKSVEKAYKIIEKQGGIDTLIFAAGIYKPMSSIRFDLEMSEKIIDINLTGSIRALNYVLPDFIRRNNGHIVLIGSVAGYRGLPDSFAYGASKAGMIHLAENLKADLYNKNIKIQVINPGFVKTRLTDMNDFEMPSLIDAKKAAKYIIDIMEKNSFESRFPNLFPYLIKFISMLPYFIYFRFVQILKPNRKSKNAK